MNGKKLTHKIASWAQRTYYRNFQKPRAPQDITAHPLYMLLRSYRASEVASIGPRNIIVTGDSRIHGAEPLIELVIPSSTVTAISGDTSVGVYKRLDDTVLAYKPRVVIDDSAGNDLLQGASPEAVMSVKKAEWSSLRRAGCNVIFLDVCPIGPALEEHKPGTIARIRRYNHLLALEYGESVLQVAPLLSDMAGMLPQFNAGDDVHHSILAYTNVYIPLMQERILQLGYSL